jgi:hypothetical protein
VFHTWLIEAEREALRSVLAHVQAAERRGEVWSARCEEVAAWVQRNAAAFTSGVRLDTTSWLAPS